MAKLTALIADDDRVVRSVLAARLEWAYEVVGGAQDAGEAIELAAEHQPDLAIVDVQMPGGGGIEAARGIRRCSPGTAIVALSADESRQGVVDMLDAGAIMYVRKNVAPEELTLRLQAALAAHARMVEPPA